MHFAVAGYHMKNTIDVAATGKHRNDMHAVRCNRRARIVTNGFLLIQLRANRCESFFLLIVFSITRIVVFLSPVAQMRADSWPATFLVFMILLPFVSQMLTSCGRRSNQSSVIPVVGAVNAKPPTLLSSTPRASTPQARRIVAKWPRSLHPLS